jgi:hypothetical protein
MSVMIPKARGHVKREVEKNFNKAKNMRRRADFLCGVTPYVDGP